jgi:spore maturation protein CgeB
MQFSVENIKEYRQYQKFATWVNINPDDPFNVGSNSSTNDGVSEAIPHFDLYCIWSRRLIAPIREAGCKEVIYLPFGYDPEIHAPPSITPHISRSVSFVGAWDRHRESILESIKHYDLRISGAAWGRFLDRTPLARQIVYKRNIHGDELAKEVSTAAVCLNLMRYQNTGSHNMRTFEVPSMGGLLLTTRSEEQHEYFPEGKACLMFEGQEELSDKIKWVLSNAKHAANIRAEGRARVVPHTYKNRAQTVLNHIQKLRGKGRER